MDKKDFFIPPRGYIAELAKITGYHRDTISDALHKNSNGIKAEKVRQLYRAKYLSEPNRRTGGDTTKPKPEVSE